MIERLCYLILRAHCLLRGHVWVVYVSPAMTIHECDRCAAQRWST